MANEKFTQLPLVANATLTDIIAAVQGGISSQETLQQVFNLMLANTVLHHAGNPNGAVAGQVYQFCYDTTNNILYICTVTGTAATAVWTNFVTNQPGWTEVLVAAATMAPNQGYVANFAGPGNCVLTMPASALFGTSISVIGKGAGLWKIQCNAGQSIIIGSASTTVGGTVTASGIADSLDLICTTNNTVWTANGAPQSAALVLT